MNLLNNPKTLYAPERAEAIAEDLNASDDWTYVAVHDPKGTGYSYIEIYDAENELIGAL